jgi:osmoprotectant transport system ATP-binding protein
VITFEHVSKTYFGGTKAVSDLCMDIEKGQTVVLLGSSGCGKTTTLKMVNRLIDPSAGTIKVDGRNILEQDVTKLRRSIGYVFQGIGLFPHLSIADNIAIVPRLLGWDKAQRRRRALELMDMVKLPPRDYADLHPDKLSGGQQQRVGVARALAADPDYLLMDEPFGALDALTRDVLQKELLSLQTEISKTIIFVTHDIFEALTLADKIAVMHEGKLHQFGSKNDILAHPATDFVKDLFGKPAEQLRLFQRDS